MTTTPCSDGALPATFWHLHPLSSPHLCSSACIRGYFLIVAALLRAWPSFVDSVSFVVHSGSRVFACSFCAPSAHVTPSANSPPFQPERQQMQHQAPQRLLPVVLSRSASISAHLPLTQLPSPRFGVSPVHYFRCREIIRNQKRNNSPMPRIAHSRKSQHRKDFGPAASIPRIEILRKTRDLNYFSRPAKMRSNSVHPPSLILHPSVVPRLNHRLTSLTRA